jgi:MoxR-like ATPase
MAQRETLLARTGRATELEMRSLALKLFEMESALASVIRGKPEALRLALVAVLSRGHLLIEDVPGVGKTTLAHALALLGESSFNRIQFTSDMLPSDVVGVTIYNAQSREFEFKPGPVFTQFLLADEINRATPKTQSALLEAMNEQQVTVDGRTYPLPLPFVVIATQNPVEHHGTYPLPESQLDRFLMRIQLGYPDPAAEREILRHSDTTALDALQPVVSSSELMQLQEAVVAIRVEEPVIDYILAIVEQTRKNEGLVLGVSPRGSQALYRAAQALALIEGRHFVIPEDVKRLAVPVFAHRVAVNSRKTLGRLTDAAGKIIEDILLRVEVPL